MKRNPFNPKRFKPSKSNFMARKVVVNKRTGQRVLSKPISSARRKAIVDRKNVHKMKLITKHRIKQGRIASRYRNKNRFGKKRKYFY